MDAKLFYDLKTSAAMSLSVVASAFLSSLPGQSTNVSIWGTVAPPPCSRPA